MKRCSYIVIAIVAIGFLNLAIACATSAQTTVRISSWHPPKHPGVVGGYKPFIKYVEQKTDSSLKFKLWTGGALLGAKDTLPGVENDIADIGVLALTYFPAEFPYANFLSELSMLSDKPLAIAAALSELVVLDCAPCREEFTRKGLVFTSTYSTSPYLMISKTKLNSPEALKGKKFRSAGSLWERWVDFVGGTSVNAPASEMFESLDRGGLDVAVFAASGLKSFSLWDVANYINMLPLGTYSAMSLFTINQNFWRGLTDTQRRAILKGSAVGAIGVTNAYIKEGEEALKLAPKHGVTIVKPSKALKEERAAFIKSDRDEVADIGRKKYGVKNPEKWITKYLSLLKKWEGIVKKNDGNPKKLIQAMQNQIYSKVDASSYGLQ
jgi:TRAP-type C4-dicarboxylate transport system substrate-binding protein